MKKNFKVFKALTLLALVVVSFTACEEDFTNLESDIDVNDNFSTDVVKYDIRAYSQKMNRVQTNNLPLALLGVYNDGTYGSTTANFIAQMSPDQPSFNPDFGENVVLDSVVLTLPYYTTVLSTNSDGSSTYELDSVYGDAPFRLSVMRNNYFLRTLAIDNGDENLNEGLVYFSDGITSEGTQINPTTDVEGDVLYEDTSFTPSADQIVLVDEDDNTTRLAPALRVRLDDLFDDGNPNTTVLQDIAYWTDLIIDREGEEELSNQNNFLNYFRGLYFKAEPITGNDNMLAFNFTTSANLVLHFSSDSENTSGDDDGREEGTFTINFSENSLNFFENDFTLNDGDDQDGDETLFIKGGEGSFAVLDMFNEDSANGTLEEFMDDFKDENENPTRLINEAFIKFYVDQSLVQGDEPTRLYIYDMKNNIPLIDYLLDQTFDKSIHLEPLKEESGAGVSYKVRVTEYVNNILLRDSTNLQLGLVVSNSVLLEGTSANAFQVETNSSTPDEIDIIPISSIIEPRGTILHGSNSSVPENLRVQLEIFYTEPNSEN